MNLNLKSILIVFISIFILSLFNFCSEKKDKDTIKNQKSDKQVVKTENNINDNIEEDEGMIPPPSEEVNKLDDPSLWKNFSSDEIISMIKDEFLKEKPDYKIIDKICEAGIDKDNNVWQYYYFYGNSKYEQKDYQKSLDNYIKAVEKLDKFSKKDLTNDIAAELHGNIGASLKNLKRYKEAMNHFRRSADYSINKSNALYNLASCYYEIGLEFKDKDNKISDNAKGYFNDAIKILNSSLSYSADKYLIYFTLADIYYSLEDYKNAEKYFIKCTEISPFEKDNYKMLVKIYEKKGDEKNINIYKAKADFFEEPPKYNSVIKHLEKIDWKNDNELAIMYAAAKTQIFMSKNEMDNAIELLNQFIKDYPDESEYFVNKSIIYFMQKDYQKSLESCLDGLKINKDDSRLLSRAASAYYKLNQNANAEKYFLKALEINPHNASIREELASFYRSEKNKNSEQKARFHQGIVFYLKGQYYDTIYSFKGLKKENIERLYEYYFYYAKAYLAIGDKVNALHYFKKAYDEKKDYYDVVIEIVNIYLQDDKKVLSNKIIDDFISNNPNHSNIEELKKLKI